MKCVKLTWLGHACFRMDCGDWSCLLDPYSPGSVPGLRPLTETVSAVYCSHGHGDHSGREGISETGSPAAPCRVTELATFHDGKRGKLRGTNVMRIFDFDGIRIAHLGDLGCELTKPETEVLSGVDCLLIPVGGHYTIDGTQAAGIAKALHPKVTVPMHFRRGDMGYDVISTPDEFLAALGGGRKTGSEVEISDKTISGVYEMTAANHL